MSISSEELRTAIAFIADAADALAGQAHVGGCETAGLIVSYLHANPEAIDSFIASPSACMINDDRFRWQNGSLSWHAKNGQIVEPSDLRTAMGVRDA